MKLVISEAVEELVDAPPPIGGGRGLKREGQGDLEKVPGAPPSVAAPRRGEEGRAPPPACYPELPRSTSLSPPHQ